MDIDIAATMHIAVMKKVYMSLISLIHFAIPGCAPQKTPASLVTSPSDGLGNVQ